MNSRDFDYNVLKALSSAGESTDDQIAEVLGASSHSVALSLISLESHKLVAKSINYEISHASYEPTRTGEAVARSGQVTLGAALAEVSSPSQTTNYNNTIGSVGQLAQGDGHTLNQTINVSISTGDLAPVLEAMRSHGDTKTADEIEKIHQAGDHPGVLRRLFERFSSKAVDAAADRAVDAALSPDYAAEILPMISDLAVSAFGGA